MRLFIWRRVKNLTLDAPAGGVVVVARDIEHATQMLAEHKPALLATCDVFTREPDVGSTLSPGSVAGVLNGAPFVALFPDRGGK